MLNETNEGMAVSVNKKKIDVIDFNVRYLQECE